MVLCYGVLVDQSILSSCIFIPCFSWKWKKSFRSMFFFLMQNSKFLQFVSKMSRGELIIDDNQVKETALPASGDWAAEYQQQYNNGHAWAGEFLNDKACPMSLKPHSFATCKCFILLIAIYSVKDTKIYQQWHSFCVLLTRWDKKEEVKMENNLGLPSYLY